MLAFRAIVERMARGVSFSRRLPEGFGPGRIVVSPDASLGVAKWDLASADPLLFATVRRLVRPELNIWDIGANLGLFGFASAWLAGPRGRLLLVEADPWLCSLLQRSRRVLAGKGYAEATIACCAISDQVGPISFDIAGRGRASNAISGLGNSQIGRAARKPVGGRGHARSALSSDVPPDLVKIDVEGAEVAVLRGAATVLAHRPVLVIEVADRGAEEATAILLAAGYRLYDAGQNMLPVERCAWATVACRA